MKSFYTNAVFFDPGSPDSAISGLLVSDGVIEAINPPPDEVPADTEMIDLEGRFLMPGFNDAHTHPEPGGGFLEGLNLADLDTREEFHQAVQRYAESHPADPWIVGRSWDSGPWEGGDPDRDEVDVLVPDRPCFLIRSDGHTAVANTPALILAGLDQDSHFIPGGVLEVDEQGRPNGILRDNAMLPVKKCIPVHTPEQKAAYMQAAAEQASELGCTTLQGLFTLDEIELARKLHAQGRLPVRFACYVWSGGVGLSDGLSDDERIKAAAADRAAHVDDTWIQTAGYKFFYDGSLGSKTALFFESYTGSDQAGVCCIEDHEAYTGQVQRVAAAGLQPITHAIGDRAVHEVLDVYATIPAEIRAKVRPRIEHAQHIQSGDQSRFYDLNVVASVQPEHLYYDTAVCDRLLGEKRAHEAYPLASLLRAQAALCLGTDWPVVALNPLRTIRSAVSRVSREQPETGWQTQESLTLEQTLAAYTAGSAFAERRERCKGGLQPGMVADFVVLDRHPGAVDPLKIPGLSVLMTVVDGQRVYQAQ